MVAVVIGSGVARRRRRRGQVRRARARRTTTRSSPRRWPRRWAPQLADAVKRAGASALLGTATSTGKDILPRAAALLGAGMASTSPPCWRANRFRRPAYAGNALEEVEVAGAGRSSRACGRPRSRRPTPAAAPGAVETVAVGAVDALGAELVAPARDAKSERPDLSEAKVVVSGGRGMREGATSRCSRS